MAETRKAKHKLTHSMDERAWNQREDIVRSILKDMEENEVNWTQGWKGNVGSQMLPRNGVSGHVYQGSNRFNLAMLALVKGYDDPRWMTFNQARKEGWHVKKGEKCAYVEHWRPVTGSRVVKDEDTGEEKTVGFSYMVCDRVSAVFNATQIEGVPKLAEDEGEALGPIEDPEGIFEMADVMIDSSRCKVVESERVRRAYYSPGEDFINVPTRLCFDSPNEFAATLAHEMGHSTGHPSALGRDLKGAFGSDDYAFEELVAELSSMFTMAELGIENLGYAEDGEHYQNHLAYLKSWNKHLSEKPELFFRAGKLAMDASEYIVERISVELEKVEGVDVDPSVRAEAAKEAARKLSENTGEAAAERVRVAV